LKKVEATHQHHVTITIPDPSISQVGLQHLRQRMIFHFLATKASRDRAIAVNLEAFKSGIEKFLQEKHRKAYHCH
jgi:hypothetical protein